MTIAQRIVDLGVKVVFGLIGHGNFEIVDELVSSHQVRFVAANREDAAVVAADAYARTTGSLGVATVTHGPGLTNTITALHESARAGSPLLLLVGDTDREVGSHEQDIDQAATVAPTGAAFVALRSPESALADLSSAVRMAHLEYRPVVFNMPVDIQKAHGPEYTPVSPPLTEGRIAPDLESLDRALGVIASARRPLIVAGRGATDTTTRDDILTLSTLIGAPVSTTLLSRGLFQGQPLDAGILGTLSIDSTVEIAAAADCLIAFGASLNRYTTADGSLVANKSLVHVDRRPQAIAKWHPVTAGVIGDSGATASQMSAMLGGSPARTWLDPKPSESPEPEVHHGADGIIDGRDLMVRLDKILPPNRQVVTDVGGFLRTALRYLPTTWPSKTIVPGSFGSIGLGVSAAIGVAVAEPTLPVVAVVGDGGFMMGGLGEFETAARNHLNIIVVVMNNGGYEIERRALRDANRPTSLADLAWPDLAPIAKAMGGIGMTVRGGKDLTSMAGAIASTRRPLLIDAQLGSGYSAA